MQPIRDIFRSHAVFDTYGKHIGGTDKQSNHSYGDAYESLLMKPAWGNGTPCLQSTRDKVKLVMEVGVADGACLQAWYDVFPNAQIVGMDIHHSDLAHGDRIEFHIGDQRVREDCERAAAGRQFDLIIEDATHKLDYTLLTLFWLWPFVRPGGLYVVEEWEGATGLRDNISALFPMAEIVGTCGPHIQDEPLVVFRKTL